MKALTVWQPYAWCLVCLGNSKQRKDIENRKRSTRIRGTVAIHAGKGTDASWLIPEEFREVMEQELAYGAIIGVVDIVDVVTEHPSDWFDGPFGYVLRNPRALPDPIPCRGLMGFWDEPEEIERQIQQQLERATKDSKQDSKEAIKQLSPPSSETQMNSQTDAPAPDVLAPEVFIDFHQQDFGATLKRKGECFRWKVGSWFKVIELAVAYGWSPQGTEPPRGTAKGTWNGDYLATHKQFVAADDARQMARSLQQAVADLKSVSKTGKASRSRALDIVEASWQEGLSDFATFCLRGTFRITDDVCNA